MNRRQQSSRRFSSKRSQIISAMRSQKLSAMNRVDVLNATARGRWRQENAFANSDFIRFKQASGAEHFQTENRGGRRKMRLPRPQGQRGNEVKTASKLSRNCLSLSALFSQEARDNSYFGARFEAK